MHIPKTCDSKVAANVIAKTQMLIHQPNYQEQNYKKTT